MNRLRLVIAIGMVAAVAVPTAAYGYRLAQEDQPRGVQPSGLTAQEPALPALSSDEAIARDGAEYAKDFGVTPEEGVRRIQAQVDSAPVVGALRRALPDRFAGIWLENEPEFKTVAWFTGELDDEVAALEQIAQESGIPVEIRVGAANSLDRLIDAQRRTLESIGVFSSSGIEETTGTVVIELLPDSLEDPLALSARLSAEHGVPFRVSVAVEIESNLETYGGTRWDGTPTGQSDGDCTTGFVVSNYVGATEWRQQDIARTPVTTTI